MNAFSPFDRLFDGSVGCEVLAGLCSCKLVKAVRAVKSGGEKEELGLRPALPLLLGLQAGRACHIHRTLR